MVYFADRTFPHSTLRPYRVFDSCGVCRAIFSSERRLIDI